MLKRGLAFFALLFIFVVYVIYPLAYSVMEPNINEQLSPYSDDYNDISKFKTDIENIQDIDEKGNKLGNIYDIYSIVASPTILNGPDVNPEETLYVAVGLEKEYTEDEVDALLEFLRNGGHAIFADDYGYLNEFARYFGVTYYQGKFFDNEFDRNENFTIVNAKLSVDQFTPYIPDNEIDLILKKTNTLVLNNLNQTPPRDEVTGLPIEQKWYDEDIPLPDGIWDSDQDNDGRVDEDPPEKGTPIDDDMDKAKSTKDAYDNDHDGILDDEDLDEGLNEDHRDDDGDWIDLNNNGVQEPMIWRDKNGDGKFSYTDVNLNNYFDVQDDFTLPELIENEFVSEYISGDFGVDEEIFDGIDNDGDTLIDEDLRGYRILFNDATGITSQGTRIIAHGGTSDPPSYVNLDDRPGANTLSADDTSESGFTERLADEISSPGSEIQLIVEVVICPECGSAVDIRTGECLDTISNLRAVDPCNTHYKTTEFLGLGSAIFISDASLFLNDIYRLDHIATHDDTNQIYELDEDGNAIQIDDRGEYIQFAKEWENAPGNTNGPTQADIEETQIIDETRRNYLMDQTPDGELDYDNQKFAKDIVKYLMPKGGMVVFDESRHYQENEFLIPVYSTIQVVTYLTSDPWYSTAIILIFVLLLTFTVGMVRNKEIWIHTHDINKLHPRASLPNSKNEQLERLRWAILNKARMSRGLSPEEFNSINATEKNNIIKDPQLIEIITNKGRTYTDDEIKMIMNKIKEFDK